MPIFIIIHSPLWSKIEYKVDETVKSRKTPVLSFRTHGRANETVSQCLCERM